MWFCLEAQNQTSDHFGVSRIFDDDLVIGSRSLDVERTKFKKSSDYAFGIHGDILDLGVQIARHFPIEKPFLIRFDNSLVGDEQGVEIIIRPLDEKYSPQNKQPERICEHVPVSEEIDNCILYNFIERQNTGDENFIQEVWCDCGDKSRHDNRYHNEKVSSYHLYYSFVGIKFKHMI